MIIIVIWDSNPCLWCVSYTLSTVTLLLGWAIQRVLREEYETLNGKKNEEMKAWMSLLAVTQARGPRNYY